MNTIISGLAVLSDGFLPSSDASISSSMRDHSPSIVSNMTIVADPAKHPLCLPTFAVSLRALVSSVHVSCVSDHHQQQQYQRFLEALIFLWGYVGVIEELLRGLLRTLPYGGSVDSILQMFVNGISAMKGFVSLRTLLLMAVLTVTFPFAAGAPVDVDLTKFTTGLDGLRVIGSAGTLTGSSLAQIGDHNGDGFQDFILSNPVERRAIIVMKGNTTYAEINSFTIVSDQYFRVIAAPTGMNLGVCVGGIGDINDDGFDDVIAGGHVSTDDVGFAFVIFGMVGPFTDLTLSNTWVASPVAFKIIGPYATAHMMALNDQARGLGDVNGDGVDDFAVSSRFYKGTTSKGDVGVVWLIFGKKTPAFDNIDLRVVPNNFGSNNGIYFTGANSYDYFGHSVRPAGDFNGDGIADFLIGSTGYDPPAVDSVARGGAGAAYLVHGSKTALATMDMSTFVTGTMGVRFLGAATSDNTGRSVSGVGDVNGDGIDDIAIGANGGDPSSRSAAGIVYVIYGTTVAFAADFDLLSFSASPLGFAIYGRAAAMQLSTVAPAGDINRDGINDILVGGLATSSRAHVIFGQTAVRTAPVDTLTDDVITFFYTIGAFLGIAVDGGKDFNGDGIPDILLGASTATVTPVEGGSPQPTGAVWMVSGFSLFPNITTAPTNAPTSGPSNVPSAVPSMEPSLAPSHHPTVGPSLVPTELPSALPSAQPSLAPSVQPSMMPSVQPSLTPSELPSANPSVQPSTGPTFDGSSAPSVDPTLSPSYDPSASPTVLPSVDPTPGPSVSPTTVPSQDPTVSPTAPSVAPTLTPSASAQIPTPRPTVPAVKDYEVVVDVEQEVFFVNQDDYDAQQAAYNKTIQHTVADATDGVTPERVTEIVVEEEEEEGRVSSASALSTRSVIFKYKVTAKDPVLTVAKLRAQLVQATQEGKMDASLRYYAAQFNATGLNNGTFALPQVISAAVQRDASEQLTGVQIALLVISVVVGLVLLASIGWYALFRTVVVSSSEQRSRGNNQLE